MIYINVDTLVGYYYQLWHLSLCIIIWAYYNISFLYLLFDFWFNWVISLYCSFWRYCPAGCVEAKILIQITSWRTNLEMMNLSFKDNKLSTQTAYWNRLIAICLSSLTPQLQIPDCCILTSQYALFCNIGVDALAAPVPHSRDPFFTTTASCPRDKFVMLQYR